MEPLIRGARPDELEGVLALWRAADTVASITDDTAALRVLTSTPTAALIVAVDGDAIVGTIVAGFDGWRGEIYRLAVSPGHRRRGIARALVAEAERFLAAKGARKLNALVMRDHGHALRFWHACSYDEDARLTRFTKVVQP